MKLNFFAIRHLIKIKLLLNTIKAIMVPFLKLPLLFCFKRKLSLELFRRNGSYKLLEFPYSIELVLWLMIVFGKSFRMEIE